MNSTTVSLGYAASAAPVLGCEFRSSFVSDATPIVFVLDEDASVRESLELLIDPEGWRCETFASAQEFLRSRCYAITCGTSRNMGGCHFSRNTTKDLA